MNLLKENFKIEKAKSSELNIIFDIYLKGKKVLYKNKIFQCTKNYPTLSIIQNDIENGYLYILKIERNIIGAINISEIQEKSYSAVNWKCKNENLLVIHRLVLDSQYRNNGYATKLLDFAEDYALQNKYLSIRLDAYNRNDKHINFYKNRNYTIRGTIRFPEKEFDFY